MPRTHVLTRSSYQAMKQRCLNPKAHGYHRYGGRGIKVCKRWIRSFDCFLADVGERPSPLHSLDRFPDPDGDYKPGNVRWATRKEQANNIGSGGVPRTGSRLDPVLFEILVSAPAGTLKHAVDLYRSRSSRKNRVR